MMWDDIDARWEQLNPVFVRGMQRSGTSVMALALQEMGIHGFGEGHLWFELVEPLEKILDPSYCSPLRDPAYALGAGREKQLVKYLALCLDRFHRDHLPNGLWRWMDKSPGAFPVRVSPMLAELFPQSQFIFLYRNGITTVHSGTKFWGDDPDTFAMLCQGWAETMSAWRAVRAGLEGRHIEIRQGEMATEPFSVSQRLVDFLGCPDKLLPVFEVFATRRVLPAFPNKRPGDYRYELNWNAEQVAEFKRICAEEMEIWDFELDFDMPGASRADLTASEDLDKVLAVLELRDARIAELEGERNALLEHLRAVESGRFMRLLNWAQTRLSRSARFSENDHEE
jgi:hypothetical protein